LFTPLFNLCGRRSEPAAGESQRLLDEETKVSPSLSGGKRKTPKLDKEKQDDPFNFLGFGMVAYRDLMFVLFLLFTTITILMIPVMSFYKQGTGIISPKGYAYMSLGNLGYSST
jgi:hypothetical protein